jgi:aspartate/methionine/tyrosine aminotransferase
VARTFGVEVRTAQLSEADGWQLDVDSLEDAITDRTVMVYVGNPNNPTGSILSPDDMAKIVSAASRVGAWLVADEIYHGAELDGSTSPSFWGTYERVIVTSSLSKAYGLAGLRLGWMVGPTDIIDEVWTYHDYTTTTTTTLSSEVATIALEPSREQILLDRALAISRSNVALLNSWSRDHEHLVSGWRTRVGGFAFLKFVSTIGSEALATRLIDEHGVLLGPGAYFGAEHYFRLGYSVPHLAGGLERLSVGLHALAPELVPAHNGSLRHVR